MHQQVKILIVDDEQIVLDSICRHLKNESDYHLYTAHSVDEALRIVDENTIHIILTDLMMPEIDGLEFLKILKDKNQNVLVIMITGYATINTALQAMQLGAFDYLAKPFTKEELKKILNRSSELVRASFVSDNGKHIFAKLNESDKTSGVIKGIGEHSWIMVEEDGNVLIGVERPLLFSIGRIQTVYLPSTGDEIRQGSVYFQIFSTDLRSISLLAPLSGIVIEVNESVMKEPNKLLQDPYGSGWLMRFKPTNLDIERKVIGL